jgi:hypothetical protein
MARVVGILGDNADVGPRRLEIHDMKRSAPLLLSMALCLSSLPSAQAQGDTDLDPAGGGTVVTVEGRIVQITVNLDVIVPETQEGLDPRPNDVVTDGFAAAASYWNQAFRGRLAANCYVIELSLVVNYIEVNKSSAGGGHDVYIHPWLPGVFNGPQLTTETTNDDTAEVFITNGTAYLPYSMFQSPGRGLPHELGHMFGLGDDYTRNADGTATYLPGREGTLMDGGDFIDQALINRIGDLARRSGEQLPQCWKGTATIASSAVYPEGGGACQDGWGLEFTFVAPAEGTIDGQGTAELTSGPTCPFPVGPSLQHYGYQVLGEETAGGFSIRFALENFGPAGGAEYAGFTSMFGNPGLPSGGPPVAVAVSGTTGTGQGEWRFRSGNPPATYSANGTITIECVASCDEAVG